MVAHHPDLPLGDLDRAERLVTARGIAGEDVRLVERLAIDLHGAGVLALDGVPADRDDPLDQVLLLGRGHQSDEAEGVLDRVGLRCGLIVEPVPGVVEDDHLAPLGLRSEPRRQLVHQHPVALQQSVLHRGRRDRERLHQKGLDQQSEHQRDADQDREFLPEGTLLLLLHAAAAPLRGALRWLRWLRGPGRFRHTGLWSPLSPIGPLFGLFVTGSCADRQIPHIHSSLRAAARPTTDAGPQLP